MNVRGKLRGNWLVTLPLLGLTICYVLLFDAPARRRARQIRSELESSLAEVGQGPLTLAQCGEAERQLARTKVFVDGWRESTPQSSGSAVLLGQISRVARDAGAHTTRLEPAAPAEHDHLRSLAVTLACVGSFDQMFELLRGIEALPQSVWIDDLRIERKQGNGSDLQCEIKLAVFADKSKISD